MDGWDIKPVGWEDCSSLGHTLSKPSNYDLSAYDSDVIFVLAGGLNEDGANHQWVIRRLDLALQLYRIKKRLIVCLGGGTYHKPPALNLLGFVMHESSVCAKYLLQNGVDKNDLMKEWASYDTIANSFFSLVNYAIPMGISSAIVITSDFHIDRAKAIFDWIYSMANSGIKLEYLSVDSNDLDMEIIQSRKKREKQSLEALQDKIKKIRNIKDFHKWFFTEHKAYNIESNPESNITEIIKKSY
jgi:uncharacterized SAM-binding protein YcdF (DUF218 family)